MQKIKLKIGITGCNRMFYSVSLLESIKRLKAKPRADVDIEVIYVDNGSEEPGLISFLENCKTIDKLILRKERDPSQDEWKGKNAILDYLSDYDVLCFIQDDTQIIDSDVFLESVVDFVDYDLYHMSLHAVRKVTVCNNVDLEHVVKVSTKTNRRYWRVKNVHLNTTGLYSRELFEKIGKYPVDQQMKLTSDGFTSAEDYMDSVAKSRVGNDKLCPLQPHRPSMASIWNDPRGMHAVVRGDRRFGHYIAADPTENLYYRMDISPLPLSDMEHETPLSFVEVCVPIGWDYARASNGDQEKYSKDLIKLYGPACFFDNTPCDTQEKQEGEDFNYLSEWS